MKNIFNFWNKKDSNIINFNKLEKIKNVEVFVKKHHKVKWLVQLLHQINLN